MTAASPLPTIRLATLSDAGALAAIGRRTFIDAFGADNTPGNLRAFLDGAYSETIQQQELASPHLTYFLAEVDHAPVAFALLRRGARHVSVTDETAVELQRIYVDRQWHGTGLAQRMMAEALRIARAEGAGTLFLGVWEKNAKALRFYERQGFVPVGSHIFHVGDDPQTDVIMVRSLRD